MGNPLKSDERKIKQKRNDGRNNPSLYLLIRIEYIMTLSMFIEVNALNYLVNQTGAGECWTVVIQIEHLDAK